MIHWQVLIGRRGTEAPSVHVFAKESEAIRFYAKAVRRSVDTIIEVARVEEVQGFIRRGSSVSILYRHTPVR